jgi:hypothetical protein
LNIAPTVVNWSADNKQFSLLFEENPLADFVELPDDGKAQDELWYSNILCGILRGALEMVRMELPLSLVHSLSTLPLQTAYLTDDMSKDFLGGLIIMIHMLTDHRCKCKSKLISKVMSFGEMRPPK